MIELQFETENQLLRRKDDEIIVNKAKNIIKASFTINGDVWNGVEKFAIFRDAFDNETTTYLGKESVCSCVVPASCLKTSFFKVTIYGGDLITTNSITIPLRDSGYHRKHHHGCGEKDIFVEIFEKIDSKIDDIVCADHCLHIFSDGRLIDSVCLPFVNEAQAIDIANERIQEFLQTDEFDDVLKQKGYINQVRLVGDEIIFE